jgi:hypothetical protein
MKYDQKMTVPRQIIKAELHKIRRSFEPKMTEAEMRAASSFLRCVTHPPAKKKARMFDELRASKVIP